MDAAMRKAQGDQMNKIHSKIEIAANISIIAVAIMIAFVLARNYLYKPEGTNLPTGVAGTKLSLPDVNWSSNNKTLVIALQQGCQYCAESAPFYQRLIAEALTRNISIVAVLPEPVEIGKKYLSDLKLPITEIRQSTLKAIGVQGTPTLLLVNSDGDVIDGWVGKLSAEKEPGVLEKLH